MFGEARDVLYLFFDYKNVVDFFFFFSKHLNLSISTSINVYSLIEVTGNVCNVSPRTFNNASVQFSSVQFSSTPRKFCSRPWQARGSRGS